MDKKHADQTEASSVAPAVASMGLGEADGHQIHNPVRDGAILVSLIVIAQMRCEPGLHLVRLAPEQLVALTEHHHLPIAEPVCYAQGTDRLLLCQQDVHMTD